MAKDKEKTACAGRQKGVSLIITFFTAFYIFFTCTLPKKIIQKAIRRVRAMNNSGKFKISLNSAELQRAKSSGSNSENGVSLIITFFIMIIILSVVLSISVLLYSEVKVVRNIGNSVASLYAAESGIEKILYYDRQVIETGATRGLCSMYLYNLTNNPKACRTSSDVLMPDYSVYCNNHSTPLVGSTDHTNGCDPIVCDDCTISFDTSFGSNDGRTYSVTAIVNTATVNSPYYLRVQSSGAFGGAERKIEINTPVQ